MSVALLVMVPVPKLPVVPPLPSCSELPAGTVVLPVNVLVPVRMTLPDVPPFTRVTGALAFNERGVRFGLTAIKNVGEGAIESLLADVAGAIHQVDPRIVTGFITGAQLESLDDDEFAYVAAWEATGGDGFGELGTPVLHKEDLVYEAIELKQRSYK